MGRRRADVRPRYGRIGVAAVSFGVTALAVGWFLVVRIRALLAERAARAEPDLD